MPKEYQISERVCKGSHVSYHLDVFEEGRHVAHFPSKDGVSELVKACMEHSYECPPQDRIRSIEKGNLVDEGLGVEEVPVDGRLIDEFFHIWVALKGKV